jgi:hypothetical protein
MGNDDDRLKLVVENSKADLERERALANFSWALRDLAANLLRVIRGAGKSYELVRQMAACLEAIAEHHRVTGMGVSGFEIEKVLREWEADRETYRGHEEEWMRRRGEEQIMRGALQIVASRLVDQLTQASAGDREMYAGIECLEEIRRKAREAREKQQGKGSRRSRAQAPNPWDVRLAALEARKKPQS